MAKGFQITKRKKSKDLALEDPKAQILSMCLQAAVPMEVVKIFQNELEMGTTIDELIERERESNVLVEQEAAFFIVGMPDQWHGKRGTYRKASVPGMGAKVFARLTRHIAVMSFCNPVKFLGACYSAEEILSCRTGVDRQ